MSHASARAGIGALILALAVPAAALAQPADRRYAEEPTDGIELPVTPLAGETDARSVSINPAGLWFLGGPSFALAVGLTDQGRADSAGSGVGLFTGATLGGGALPRIGWGMGLEWVRPPRTALVPDPGTPVRFTLAEATALGRHASLGLSWHHFWDDGITGGLDTFDVGLAARIGNRWSLGAVVRDLGAPTVGGGPVQRRYELELGSRPLGTDRLDLGLGGRVGEIRGDVDGWLRASVRVARGVYVHAEVATRELHTIDTTATGTTEGGDRDLRGTVGLELSFGGAGVSAYGSGGIDRERDVRGVGGTLVARLSAEQVPSVLGHRDRIERIELTGALGSRGLVALIFRLRAIERDPHVVGVVFAIDSIGAGWATLEDLRDEIARVRAAGKKTFAYMVAGNTRDYWVATACDRIYIDPAGGIRLLGMAGTTLYFKGTFDKLGVQAQFEKIAEYKSAPESYTRTGPTEPALRMRNELYDSVWNVVVDGIAKGRHLDRATVEQLIANGPYTSGDLAKDKRLVDAVGEPDKISELVTKELGGVYPVSGPPRERGERWAPPAIAVIYIDGDIVDGQSRKLPVPIPIPLIGQEMAGGDTITAAIQAAAASRDVKAIILRVDSPGGSALASDLIAREIKKARQVKPVICSMGNLAASGGYYVSAYCDWIVAEPATITGSIGIFTGKFDVSGMLSSLGVSWQTFRHGPRSDMESYFRPYTDEERKVILEKLHYLYDRFTGTVAEGRKLKQAEVDAIGRGHVWSGAQALPIKLVDQLGGFGAALDVAKQRAGLGPDDVIRVVQLPKPPGGLLTRLLESLTGVRAGGAAHAAAVLPVVRALIEALPASVLAEPDVPQARLDFNLRWE